jgi:hypothetical protein
MPSRWMAPKKIKLTRPYTDAQQMWLRGNETHRGPAPEVLDDLADAKFSGGWDIDRVCPRCGQAAYAKSGQCVACEMYVPDPPRTLQQRQDARRLAVAVAARTPKPPRKRAPRVSRKRARALAQMGLR